MIEDLLNRQNQDGGWSYRSAGSSWTEPTCLSVLAQLASGVPWTDASLSRAAAWIDARQNADGAWPPHAGVPESTWVTAMVLLLPPELLSPRKMSLAESWLHAQTGRESGFWQQLRLRLLGAEIDPAQAFDGWPWYPGAAAWVVPTAMSILALDKLSRRDSVSAGGSAQRIQEGRDYLLARRCRDGGWNHGSTRALGYDSDSYPETTGLALLALSGRSAGTDQAQLDAALSAGRRHLQNCESLEAASWLTLGLSAHGDAPPVPQQMPHGGTNELALAVIASEALKGRNVLVL